MNPEDITNRFKFHPATRQEAALAHANVRVSCKELAHQLDVSLPEGREKSLAITKLEEVMFWANAAIARNGEQA